MSQGRFGLDVRRQFFMQRVVRQWHRLPKEAVDAHPIPAGIRGQAGCGSGQPGLLVGDLHTAGGWDWMSAVLLCDPGHAGIL